MVEARVKDDVQKRVTWIYMIATMKLGPLI